MQYYEILLYLSMRSASTLVLQPSLMVCRSWQGTARGHACGHRWSLRLFLVSPSGAARLPCMGLACEGRSLWLWCLGRVKLGGGMCITTHSNRLALFISSQVVPWRTLNPLPHMACAVVGSSHPAIMQQCCHLDMLLIIYKLYSSPVKKLVCVLERAVTDKQAGCQKGMIPCLGDMQLENQHKAQFKDLGSTRGCLPS